MKSTSFIFELKLHLPGGFSSNSAGVQSSKVCFAFRAEWRPNATLWGVILPVFFFGFLFSFFNRIFSEKQGEGEGVHGDPSRTMVAR